MTTNRKGQFVPLRNVPIHMNVDGVTVVGEILTLSPNDMTVVIKEPFSGFGTYLHVPHFAMCAVNWLATFEGRKTTAILKRRNPCADFVLSAIRRLGRRRRRDRCMSGVLCSIQTSENRSPGPRPASCRSISRSTGTCRRPK
jgi:hypothetical protein